MIDAYFKRLAIFRSILVCNIEVVLRLLMPRPKSVLQGQKGRSARALYQRSSGGWNQPPL
jgi:hypothetical protein